MREEPGGGAGPQRLSEEPEGDPNSEGKQAALMENRGKEQRERQTEEKEKQMPELGACDVREKECKPCGRQTRGEPEEWAETESDLDEGWRMKEEKKRQEVSEG